MNKIKDILIVDDEDLMRSFLETALSEDYNVETAMNGKEGLEKIKANNYDLVLTDIRMPEIDGITLLKEIKRLNKSCQVIVMTAYGTVEDAVDAMKIGAYDYIQKPFSADEIEIKVKRVFDYQELLDTKNYLMSELQGKYGEKNIVAKSYKMQRIFDVVKAVADSKATILITGESGTGKEMIAHAIHYNSIRREKPFIKLNCAALPENLLESELFGHEKGAFTGAISAKKGKFELADGGTILLDEISEMPLLLQAKLLRVIQEREFDKVGGTKPVKVDVRIIATTNRDLQEEISNNNFREDLFFRLNVVPIDIPPLRERKEDILSLAMFFLEKFKNEKQ